MKQIENKKRYPNLFAQMIIHNENYEKIGHLLNRTKSAVGRRMNGEVAWEIDDIKILCEHYEKTFEELFC